MRLECHVVVFWVASCVIVIISKLLDRSEIKTMENLNLAAHQTIFDNMLASVTEQLT